MVTYWCIVNTFSGINPERGQTKPIVPNRRRNPIQWTGSRILFLSTARAASHGCSRFCPSLCSSSRAKQKKKNICGYNKQKTTIPKNFEIWPRWISFWRALMALMPLLAVIPREKKTSTLSDKKHQTQVSNRIQLETEVACYLERFNETTLPK